LPISTVSSSINSVATVLTTDLWKRLGWRGLADDGGLRLARWLTALIGILATLSALALAELNLKSLWDSYNSLVGLAASGLAGLFALGIFSKRANGPGALIGAAASALVLSLVQSRSELHFFLYAGIGILSCVGVGWLASHLFPAPTQDLEQLSLHQSSPKETP
ncbi:MAG: sodium:solute symporter family transporter, partial [Verrucomicrobiales bacterium]